MLRKITGAALLSVSLMPLTFAGAGATASAPLSRPPVAETLIEKTHYRYCRRWHQECRARWGYGWRYRRCMARHGC